MTDASLIQIICSYNGSMDYDELISVFSPFGNVVSKLQSTSERFAVVQMNGQKKVVVKSSVRLCRAQKCSGCEKLHLCKHYLLGSCRFDTGRRGCRFGHDLSSNHNAAVLSAHDLNLLDRKQLCVVLLQSDTSLLPAVCHSYNNGTGEFGQCQDGANCRRLHICEKYLRGPCQCPRAHDFYEPHPLKILQDRGVTTNLMGIMKEIYTNIEALRDISRNKQPSASDTTGLNTRRGMSTRNQRPSDTVNAEKTEICMYYIKGHCKHGGSCRREHCILPYQWQVQDRSEWKNLPDSEIVEKDYCNPAKSYSSGAQPVCFDTMTWGSYGVRRLSTVPSVIQPTFILTTDWIWYWEDEFGNWIQYGTAEGGHTTSSVSSVELEQRYQTDSRAKMEITAGSQTYELSFTDMIQTNKRYGTKKLIRRRPKFVSAANVQKIKTLKRVPNHLKALPDHWDKSLIGDTGFKRVSLPSSSGEHSRIKQLFSATMRAFSILRIERIQNKALWEVFEWQKDQMKKNNGGREVLEKQLFHGTDPKHLDAICLNNFDWRICGTHGTAYGKGSYFARDAEYSHNYTKDSGTRCMFVCRVLVGDYTRGVSSYLRPPSKDGGDTIFYDSCVNDVYNPSIFVVFEKHQIYPEYLIEYTDSSQYYPQTPTAATRVTPVTPVRRPAYIPSVTASYSPSVYTTPSYASSSPSSSSSSTPQPSSSKSDCIIS